MTTYGAVSVASAVFVFFDARSRGVRTGDAAGFAFLALLLWPVVIPVYLAKRPLRNGETREGGAAWNVIRNLVLMWTAICAFWGAKAFVIEARNYDPELEAWGLMGEWMGIFVLWIVPAAGALIVGMLLRRPSVVETGERA